MHVPHFMAVPKGYSEVSVFIQDSTTTDQWISLGLSHDQYMGDDSVMECVMNSGSVQVKTSFNTGKYNDYPDDKHAGLHNYAGSIKDGVLECNFERKIEYPREPKVFNLRQPYYLMVAFGEAVSGNKFPHSYETLPKVSADKIDFQQVGSVKGGANPVYPMVKAHGTAMTFAWMFFASSGLFIARHGRSMFNNSKPFGILVWFHSKGYSKIPDSPGNKSWYRMLHPPIGLVVIVMTFVNPIMALFRPEPKAPSRKKFNWIHWGIGTLAYIFAFALMLIGLDLTKSQADVEAIYVVFAFIGYHVVMEILIRAVPFLIAAMWGCCKSGCCKSGCCRRSKRSYDLGMSEMSGSELPSMTSEKDLGEEKPVPSYRRKNVVRTFLLIFHMLASACFSIAVLYFFLKHPIDQAGSKVAPTERSEHDDTVRIVGPF
ncbi:DOMON domain-containing protein frrs1L [Bulinus truncatus]|nr:DOMON domain-containing protein frrs1L [Bulinus truncatus]